MAVRWPQDLFIDTTEGQNALAAYQSGLMSEKDYLQLEQAHNQKVWANEGQNLDQEALASRAYETEYDAPDARFYEAQDWRNQHQMAQTLNNNMPTQQALPYGATMGGGTNMLPTQQAIPGAGAGAGAGFTGNPMFKSIFPKVGMAAGIGAGMGLLSGQNPLETAAQFGVMPVGNHLGQYGLQQAISKGLISEGGKVAGLLGKNLGPFGPVAGIAGGMLASSLMNSLITSNKKKKQSAQQVPYM